MLEKIDDRFFEGDVVMDLLVLIVDDEFLIVNTLQRLIENFVGCRIISSLDPESALQLKELQKGEVDMVIADYMMPRMKGAEFLTKTRETCPNAVRILLTEYNDEHNVPELINQAGLLHYVEKPWDNNHMLKVIKEGLEKVRIQKEVERQNKELILWNKTLENRVKNRVASIRNLLDNATEGFLTIKQNLVIDEEYSKQCVEIFGREIGGEKFSQLLFPNEGEDQFLADEILSKVMVEKSKVKAEAFLSLMPLNVSFDKKQLFVEYKLVEDPEEEGLKAVMVIINDISDKIMLENQVDKERRRLKMVVGAVVDSRSFFDNIEAYKNFFQYEIHKLLEKEVSLREVLDTIFMRVHTFKGIMALKEMNHTVEKLHDLESEIDTLKEREVKNAKEVLLEHLTKVNPKSFMDKDLKILKEILGEGFLLKGDVVEVPRDILEGIEKSVASLDNTEEKRKILEAFKKLKFVPLYKLVKGYEDYTIKLAEKLGKCIHPFLVEGGKMYVDPLIYEDFIKSLIHIFRNITQYGIEDPEERVEKGKDQHGKVRFKIKEDQEHLLFMIGDDGAGIQISNIKKKALEKKLMTKEELFKAKDKEIVQLIFEPNFSTNQEVDLISGRGIGLSAVKAEVDKLKGSIEVMTKFGLGTVMKISIPKR
jgi:two-component system, chemotaxis family, sensor kinase CheA